jgi:hypothetical protein
MFDGKGKPEVPPLDHGDVDHTGRSSSTTAKGLVSALAVRVP